MSTERMLIGEPTWVINPGKIADNEVRFWLKHTDLHKLLIGSDGLVWVAQMLDWQDEEQVFVVTALGGETFEFDYDEGFKEPYVTVSLYRTVAEAQSELACIGATVGREQYVNNPWVIFVALINATP